MTGVKEILNNIRMCEETIKDSTYKIQLEVQNLLKTKDGQKKLFDILSMNMFLTLSFLNDEKKLDLVNFNTFSNNVLIETEKIAEKYFNDKFLGTLVNSIALTYIGEDASLANLQFDDFYLYLISEKNISNDNNSYLYFINNDYNTYKIIKDFVIKNYKKIYDKYCEKYLLLDIVEYLNIGHIFINDYINKITDIEKYFNVPNILDSANLEGKIDIKKLYEYIKINFK